MRSETAQAGDQAIGLHDRRAWRQGSDRNRVSGLFYAARRRRPQLQVRRTAYCASQMGPEGPATRLVPVAGTPICCAGKAAGGQQPERRRVVSGSAEKSDKHNSGGYDQGAYDPQRTLFFLQYENTEQGGEDGPDFADRRHMRDRRIGECN